MSKERELLKRCLEKTDVDFDEELANEIEMLLAQPEPKPVAWILEEKETGYKTQVACRPSVLKDGWKSTPLYTTPNREPLSLTEIQKIWDENAESGTRENFVRSIEKAHGIGVEL